MRDVLIDISRLLGRSLRGRLPTGVDRVSLAYVGHFGDRARAIVRYGPRTMLFSQADSQKLFGLLQSPPPDFNWKVRWMVACEFLKFRRNRDFAGAFLFNTGHSGLEKSTYPHQLRRQRVKPVFLVHDLIPITHPEYCRSGELGKHVIRMNNVLELAAGVIANSQATLQELENYARQTGRAMPPSVAAPLAAAPLPAPAEKRPLRAPYFVMLGTIEPRKNHWLMLQLWRKLVEKHGERAPRLVVIGQRGWECENVVDLLERCESLQGFVKEFPTCTDTELATWLHHAQALLFPSFAEGYGMPLAEALSLGVPVIASDLPAFREIAGAIPDYLAPLDGTGWMQHIEAYATTDSSERIAQLARVKDFAAPSWHMHFQLVEKLLAELQ
ncbi:glycosyltransferase family 1 protein [Janthinobacterium sp. 17J80-10]|uniref:glycosyltransferase family 4 protein n=1 Tax=Janthinobacterium sp. 17J80-10 TaxID=2497863 RepID=UPI0010052E63|nr:glycosyltransferase family 1 protein [Janthinobacterium sp. 17J80-10]QAU35552.1 glycosyltransferase family 1 protein [Janthinobacterium sp. 17J80-10]